MDIESFRHYCLSLPGTDESLPFDNNTLVFKVMGKMFALADIDGFDRFNVKCDPATAEALRAQYACVQPGYHMSKKHWNTIVVDGELSDDALRHWIRHSYDLVAAGLPKRDREALAGLS
jgi:predicted DNA-binding protein (MmcQ/YjbR family)